MKPRALVSARALAACLVAFSLSSSAIAQPISDADKQAARDLYYRGVELQNAGKFAEALDAFKRAERVIDAPTNLLHIAECQAALGHLVEATETYRRLINTRLATGAPAAFVAAQKQGRAELQQIDPRVPSLKVIVVPDNIPTLSVSIDGAPMHTALIGQERPVNPGKHKVIASAPGYTTAEQELTIAEKEVKTVKLNLTSGGGVVYGPAPGTAGDTPSATGDAGNGAAATPVPDAPQPFVKPNRPDTRSKTSLFFGLRLGATFPAGKFPFSGPGTTTTVERPVSDVSGVGGSIGLDSNLRLGRIFYLGLVLEGTGFSKKNLSGTNSTADSSAGMFGGRFGYISNPEGVAFIADLGLAYRGYSLAIEQGGNQVFDTRYDGVEFSLGAGVHFKVGNLLRLVPKAELSTGVFSDSSQTIGSVSSGTTTVGHTFFWLGMASYFDIDLDKKKAEPPPPMTPAPTPEPAPATTPSAAPESAPATPEPAPAEAPNDAPPDEQPTDAPPKSGGGAPGTL